MGFKAYGRPLWGERVHEKWHFLTTDKCPRCGAKEYMSHVWFCQSPSANKRFNVEFVKLQTWLNGQHTHGDLSYIITTTLKKLRAGKPITFEKEFQHLDTIKLITTQQTIGWRGFTQGLLATEWAHIQQSKFSFLNSRRTGSKWTRSLINKLHKIHQGLWEDRNEINNSEDNVTYVEGLDKLNEDIRIEYERGSSSVLPQEKHLFKTTLNNLLKTSLTNQRQWIDTVWLSQRQKQQNEQSCSMDASRRIMAKFLQRNN